MDYTVWYVNDSAVRYCNASPYFGAITLLAYSHFIRHISGQRIEILLPELDFELPSGLPIQLEVSSEDAPKITIEWEFKLAFGFDEDDGE